MPIGERGEIGLGRGRRAFDKRAAIAEALIEHRLTADEVAFMGDDLVDLPALAFAGLAAAPADAAAEVDLVAHCAQLAGAARRLGVPVVHCTAETRADGRGANRNARLFAGILKSPVQMTPGTPAVQVPDCSLALAHGTGGNLGTRTGAATLILGQEGA